LGARMSVNNICAMVTMRFPFPQVVAPVVSAVRGAGRIKVRSQREGTGA
jgi:hypothetical protein